MYATIDNMLSRFDTRLLIQLTDEAETGAIDQARVTAALDDATEEMNSYIKAVYTLPLAAVPAVLTRRCCDIALYLLYRDAAPDRVKTAYDEAISWLKDIAKGIVKLDAGGAEPAAAPAIIETAPSIVADRRDCMRGF